MESGNGARVRSIAFQLRAGECGVTMWGAIVPANHPRLWGPRLTQDSSVFEDGGPGDGEAGGRVG